MIEGPAGTGKTVAACVKIVARAEAHPNSRHLICRQTRASMTESVLVTLENKVLWTGHPAMSGNASRANRHAYDFPNGSTIVCGGLDNPERMFSTEWDTVYVAEATETTLDSWEKFARAMRNNMTPYHQQIADCNPGAPGHWLNKRADTPKMARLFSRHSDNPSVTPEYLTGLRGLSGHRRARLYEGRWKAAEGAVYPEFDESIHVIQPFAIPRDWPVYVAKDPGRDHPDATIFCAVAPNGRLYLILESCVRNTTTAIDGARLTELCKPFNVVKKIGDPHYMFSATKMSDSGRTIAEQMRDYGHVFTPAPAARNQSEIAQQVEMVRTLLTSRGEDGAPMLQVFNTLQNTINGFQSWGYVRNTKGEQLGGEDRFEDIADDEMDAVRMVVASRPTFEQKNLWQIK